MEKAHERRRWRAIRCKLSAHTTLMKLRTSCREKARKPVLARSSYVQPNILAVMQNEVPQDT